MPKHEVPRLNVEHQTVEIFGYDAPIRLTLAFAKDEIPVKLGQKIEMIVTSITYETTERLT